MHQRLDEFNKKFIYTETNPENIISAKKNSIFFRKGNEFYVNYSGNLDGHWEKLSYKTVTIPPPPATKLIKYKYPQEIWVKTTDGFFNDKKELMPKTGWKFVSNTNLFAKANPKKLNWIFPVPTSSNDSIGNNNSRSYDENFFYAKISGKWYRTPISVFTFPDDSTAEDPYLTNNLPFVDTPRFRPSPPSNSNVTDGSVFGDQTYGNIFFYIKVSKWKRSRLNIYYDTNKMTKF